MTPVDRTLHLTPRSCHDRSPVQYLAPLNLVLLGGPGRVAPPKHHHQHVHDLTRVSSASRARRAIAASAEGCRTCPQASPAERHRCSDQIRPSDHFGESCVQCHGAGSKQQWASLAAECATWTAARTRRRNALKSQPTDPATRWRPGRPGPASAGRAGPCRAAAGRARRAAAPRRRTPAPPRAVRWPAGPGGWSARPG